MYVTIILFVGVFALSSTFHTAEAYFVWRRIRHFLTTPIAKKLWRRPVVISDSHVRFIGIDNVLHRFLHQRLGLPPFSFRLRWLLDAENGSSKLFHFRIILHHLFISLLFILLVLCILICDMSKFGIAPLRGLLGIANELWGLSGCWICTVFVAAPHVVIYIHAIYYTLTAVEVVHFNFLVFWLYLALRRSFVIHVGLDPKRLQIGERFTAPFAHFLWSCIVDFH